MDMKKLEQRISDLESKLSEPTESKKPPRPPRKPSEYNIFMGKFMADDKKKNPDKVHTQRFIDATKAWGEKKPKP